MLKKPTDKVTLSAEEAEAVLARVYQSNLGADDARIVECVFRMYLWVAFTLQEAKVSVKRLRDLFFGRGRTAKTPPESAVPSSETLGKGEGGGESVPVEEEAAGTLAVGDEEEASASPAKPKVGTVRGRVAWVPMPMQVPLASSAATRSWRWGSAARCAVKATSMSCPPGWRFALTATPCSVPYTTS